MRDLTFLAAWIDPTYMNNKLTMDVILEMGGLAPRNTYVLSPSAPLSLLSLRLYRVYLSNFLLLLDWPRNASRKKKKILTDTFFFLLTVLHNFTTTLCTTVSW